MRTSIIVLVFCFVSVLAETPTYFFSHPNKETWDVAKTKCEVRGQKLAKIKTWIKKKDIKDVVSIFNLDWNDRNNSIWSSGNSLAVENVYVWEDNTRIQLANWKETSNTEDTKRKDCVALWDCCESGFKFVVDSCEEKYYYLCESNVNI